jgi:hypothetical protein
VLLILSSYILFRADIGHEEPGADAEPQAATDGGTTGALPDDAAKLGPAGVVTSDEGNVTRVDHDGNDYRYDRGGYLERFGVYGFGGGLIGGHSMNLALTPWNMVVFTVPAAVLGGQIAPYVAAALDTDTLKRFVAIVFAVIATALFVLVGQAVL